jgi:phosphopantetheine adenylyltransferase
LRRKRTYRELTSRIELNRIKEKKNILREIVCINSPVGATITAYDGIITIIIEETCFWVRQSRYSEEIAKERG